MKYLSVVPTFVTMTSCKTSETLTEHSDFPGHFKPWRKIPNTLQILQSPVRGVYAVHPLLTKHWVSAVKDLSVMPTFTASSICKTSETLTENIDFKGDFRP
jgi:hypothetical protein